MADFLEKYVEQLIKFCKVPKFQNERALSIRKNGNIESWLPEFHPYASITSHMKLV